MLRVALFAPIITTIGASPAFAADPMAPSEIQATFFNGQPFMAVALSGTKFKMTFTPDGKMTRETSRAIRYPERWYLEAQCERLLHLLESFNAELLHADSQRRK